MYVAHPVEGRPTACNTSGTAGTVTEFVDEALPKSPDVITRLPVPVYATATNIPLAYATDDHELSAALV